MRRRSESWEGWGLMGEKSGGEAGDAGQSWWGLEGRKKDAEGRMPPAWVAVCGM